jgi:hypothetical protein
METDYSGVVKYLNQTKKDKTNNGERIGILNSNGNILPYPFKKGMAIVYKENSIEGKLTISLPLLSLTNFSRKMATINIHNFPEKYIKKMNSK